MERKYCGTCRGERGCKDCASAVKTAEYTGITGFFPEGTGTTDGTCLVGVPKKLFLAADLGTTTLAFVCTDEGGHVLSSYGTVNPQRSTSSDVVGRIDAACHGDGEALKKQIREALGKGFLFVLRKAGAVLEPVVQWERLPVFGAVGGNTTMQHLLCGYPVEGLGAAPFRPYSLKEAAISFAELWEEADEFEAVPENLKEAEFTILPCLSAFVGGDAVAGAYGLSLGGDGRRKLLLDFGTNGELLLWQGEKMYVTSTAMGSAFEGGHFAYAADMFRLIKKARECGVLDKTGLLADPYFDASYEGLTQADVRCFQLAKGAIRAGIELLCRKADCLPEQIEMVYVAGGIGAYCEEELLLAVGILPPEFAGKTKLVGNSCIGGLVRYLKEQGPVRSYEYESISLAEEPEFEAIFYQSMDF